VANCCTLLIDVSEQYKLFFGLQALNHPVTRSDTHEDSSVLYKSSQEDPSIMEGSQDGDDEKEMVTSGVLLIKKSYISLIRPMDLVESVAVNGSDVMVRGGPVTMDVLKLVSVLIYVDDNIPEGGKVSFDKCLKQLKTPLTCVSELFAQDLSFGEESTMTGFDLVSNVSMNLTQIEDIVDAITGFLDLLDVAQPDLADEITEKSKWLLHMGHLFGSHLGMSFVSTSLHQMISLRFALCRSLLIIVQLFQGNSFQEYLPKNKRPNISAEIVDRTCRMIQCYSLLKWIAETPIHGIQSLDTVQSCVSILKLNEGTSLLVPRYSNTHSNVTILYHFLQSSASASVRLILSRLEISTPLLPVWKYSFLPFLQVLTQLIWPVCGNTVFAEFLLFSAQHLHAQEYTRLLSKWCHSNSHTSKSLLLLRVRVAFCHRRRPHSGPIEL